MQFSQTKLQKVKRDLRSPTNFKGKPSQSFWLISGRSRKKRNGVSTLPKNTIKSVLDQLRKVTKLRFANSVIAASLVLFPAVAASEPEAFGSYHHYEEVPNVLFLVAEIKAGDSFELRRAMRDYEIDLVVAASAGGNVYDALQMASILNDKGVNTYIPENARCESSCAKIFLGGRSRMVLGELGVHQFYSGASDAASQGRKDVTTAATQYTTSDIIGILNEFETPPFVYEKMFGTTEMYYFRSSEKQRLGLKTDNEGFLGRIDEVDKFLSINQEALRQLRRPESTAVAAAPPKLTQPVPNTEKPPVSERTERIENTDFFGSDLYPSGIRHISLNSCENYCENNPLCAAYSYVHATSWCWPKRGVENVSIASGVTSAVVNPAKINPDVFNRPFIEATSIDIPGYDLYPKGLRNMSLDQCRHACQATTNCVAWSYVPKKSWCFPKYGSGNYTKQMGVISGVVNGN